MTVSAFDPEFKLSGVTLLAERAGQKLLDRPLLAASQSGMFYRPIRVRYEGVETRGRRRRDVLGRSSR